MDSYPKWIAWIVLALVLVGGWWVLKHKPVTESMGDTIKIGVILPLTGDAAVYGEPARNVMQLAAEKINAEGGVEGKPLELIFEDGKCEGKDAASAMQKLSNVDKVQVVIGGFCSSESLSAEPIATQAKVALFSAGSSNPGLTNVSPYFSRIAPSDSGQGKIDADMLADMGIKKVVAIQEQTDYAQGVYQAFEARFIERGGTVTKEEFPTEASDFRSSLAKLKAESPEALLLFAQTATAGAKVLKQVQEIDWKVQLVLVDSVMSDSAFLTENAAALEGALGAEIGANLENPKFKELAAAYKEKYGTEVPYQAYAQLEYDAVLLVADAVRSVGYDGTKIAGWLHNVNNWDGATGLVTIGANGDPQTGHTPKIVRNGKTEPYTK